MEKHLGRRGLFKKFIPFRKQPQPELSQQLIEIPAQPWQPTIKITRADFIKGSVGLGTTLVLGNLFREVELQQTNPVTSTVTDQEPLLQNQPRGIQFSPEQISKVAKHRTVESYVDTTLKQTFATLLKDKVGNFLEKMGMSHGNQSYSRERWIEGFKKEPLSNIVMGGLLIPVGEEAAFRLSVSKEFIKDADNSMRWDIGLPTSLAFALMHNIHQEGKWWEVSKLGLKKSIPAEQFIGGLTYWYFTREKGYEIGRAHV